ncbi:hypothetical protein PSAC2689_20089 [Paraburkholderia sacchari]
MGRDRRRARRKPRRGDRRHRPRTHGRRARKPARVAASRAGLSLTPHPRTVTEALEFKTFHPNLSRQTPLTEIANLAS